MTAVSAAFRPVLDDGQLHEGHAGAIPVSAAAPPVLAMSSGGVIIVTSSSSYYVSAAGEQPH
ncbi:hypothetical protein PJ985_00550 [Streptomyces sp. ACA25]|uniref:hypothetical protein n=1 Tax=Streptomyces sp. ACA25 TaxID=3022596 RepID=UPI0023070166|nr:hypothetical protein [Streptomyces sp. ACA25]MDB1086072.1 hypothetical protein [Streptomyces sp. ACA25]